MKQSGTSNTPERIWSSVSERVVPPVRNETVCFTIGRTQTDDPFQTSHEVKEMVHPQLKTQGFQFWVALPVATFSSEFFSGCKRFVQDDRHSFSLSTDASYSQINC